MKAVVFVLVLANLLFFAYAEGYFDRPENPDAERVAQQVKPESIRVVARDEAPPLRAGDERRDETTPPPAAPAQEKAAPPDAVCLSWSGLAAKDADRLAALLGERFQDFKLSRQLAPGENATWWVFIPPLPSKADADRKAGELARLGIEDYFVVQEAGPNRFAISLGVFSSEGGAGERLAALKTKGVRSARSGLRSGKGALAAIEVRGPASREAALRQAVSAVLPDIPGKACQ